MTLGTARRAMVGAILATAISAGTVVAQDCNSILSHGIWETHSGTSEITKAKLFISSMCSQNAGNHQKSRDFMGSIGVPIEGVPVEFKGEYKEKQSGGYFRAVCAYQEEYAQQISKHFTNTSKASETIVKAWEKCVNGGGALFHRIPVENSSLFSFRMSYRQQKGSDPDIQRVNSLKIIQYDSKGVFAPVICRVLTGPPVKFNKEGEAAPFSLPNFTSVTFLCNKQACSTAQVNASARVTLSVDRLEFPADLNAKSGCVPPPITNCVKYDATGTKCHRCEFEVNSLNLREVQVEHRNRDVAGTWNEYMCSSMPQGAVVKSQFSGAQKLGPTCDSGMNPLIATIIRGADGKLVASRSTANCSMEMTPYETGFVVPQKSTSGQALGAIRAEFCQAGGNPNKHNCSLIGTFAIFTPEGLNK